MAMNLHVRLRRRFYKAGSGWYRSLAVDYASNYLDATDPIVIFFVYFASLDNEYQPKGRILAVL
jgi:hypothetical protein